MKTTIRVLLGAAVVVIMAFNFVAYAATPVITSPNTAAGQVGVPFSYQVTATNNPTNFSASAGLTAAGLSIDASTGLISGSPTTAGTFTIVILAGNSEGNSPGNWFLTLTITGTSVPDLPPTTPTGLRVTLVGLHNVELEWNASTDDKGVERYKVFRDNVEIGSADKNTCCPTSYSVPGVPNTTYSYFVVAVDAAGNESAKSNTIQATTKSFANVIEAPKVVSFFHNNSNGIDATIKPGQTTSLVFKVTGKPLPEISINNGVGVVTGSSVSVSPQVTTTYTLTATNSAGSETASLTVKVVNKPTIGKWALASDSAPVNRGGMSALVFKNKMWVMGAGSSIDTSSNDVWSSEDGVNWNLATANATWAPRYGQASVVFKNKMWVLGGGDGGDDNRANDVWSSEDGVNWNLATANAAWAPRYVHSAVVFDNKMWVMGGLLTNATTQTTQGIWWSEDGVNWNLATANPGWFAGNVFTTLVFNNKMWVIGDTVGPTSPPFKDPNSNASEVWSSSDGITWTQMTKNIGFRSVQFSSYGAVVFNNKIWAMAGRATEERSRANEVFSSTDGITWQQENIQGGWEKIDLFATLVHKNTIWVVGGLAQNVWKLELTTPVSQTPASRINTSTIPATSPAAPESTTATTPTSNNKVTVTAKVLNVRSGPGISNKIANKVRLNDVLEKVEARNGWIKVILPNKQTGWVFGKFVK